MKRIGWKNSLAWMVGAVLVASSCTPRPASPFKDNGYQNDMVYISGEVRNLPAGKNLQIVYTKLVEDEQARLDIAPDSTGRFEARVPVVNSTSLLLYQFVRSKPVNLFAEPGERIEIRADWKEGRVAFSGEHAQTHQQVYAYRRHVDSLALPYNHVETIDRSITHEEFFRRIRADWYRNDSLLDGYRAMHPDMPERAVAQLRTVNLHQFATRLMQRRFALDFKQREPFPESYLRHADSVFAIYPRPYTLGSLTFLRDYLDYYYEQHQASAAPNMKMLFGYMKEHLGMELTEQQQMDWNYLNTPGVSAALNEAAMALAPDPAYEAALIDRWCGGIGLVSAMPDDLKQLMYAHYHYFHLDGSRKAMHAENVERFRGRVKNPALAAPVLRLQEKLADLARMTLDEQLLQTEYSHLEGCKDGGELFRKILEPYRGKLVYLDIWGTWCSPCKQQMEHVGYIKQAMKGKEVVFLYLANRSPKDSWENVIKEYGLAGGQAVHYNLPDAHQDMLEKHLQVKSYPTYLLIGREGDIVDRNPPRPDSEDKLVDYLNGRL